MSSGAYFGSAVVCVTDCCMPCWCLDSGSMRSSVARLSYIPLLEILIPPQYEKLQAITASLVATLRAATSLHMDIDSRGGILGGCKRKSRKEMYCSNKSQGKHASMYVFNRSICAPVVYLVPRALMCSSVRLEKPGIHPNTICMRNKLTVHLSCTRGTG